MLWFLMLPLNTSRIIPVCVSDVDESDPDILMSLASLMFSHFSGRLTDISQMSPMGKSMIVVVSMSIVGCSMNGYSAWWPSRRFSVSTVLAITNCLTAMSAMGLFRTS